MNKNPVILMLMGLLAAGGAAAADAERDKDVEAKLEAARDKLEEAAREVARLSAEVGAPMVDRLMLLHEGMPRRAIIGVQLDPKSGEEGARVEAVSPGGPAAEAGIRVGDVIVNVNGQDVRGEGAARKVMRSMSEVAPDSKVKVQVLRDGKPQTFEVAARPVVGRGAVARGMPFPPSPGAAPFSVPPGPLLMHSPFNELADMELATLSPGLGKYFGTEQGVLVVRAPESDAFKLEDGDVILSIDGREPTSSSHATRILRSYQPGEKLNLRIMRQRKPVSLEVAVPERRGGERRIRRIRDGQEPVREAPR